MIKLNAFESRHKSNIKSLEIKDALESLPSKIELIESFEVGLNLLESERAFDIDLISKFKSCEGLQIYSDYPEHPQVFAHNRKLTENVVSLNFEK